MSGITLSSSALDHYPSQSLFSLSNAKLMNGGGGGRR